MKTDTYSEIVKMAERAGMSVTGLCRAAGVSPGTVTRWRSGITQPTFRIWSKLEKAADAARKEN